MFIGVYLALCGIQYLIVAAASIILLGRRSGPVNLPRFLGRYTLAALLVSLLGLALFSLIASPLGDLHINLPQDLRDPARALRSLAAILVMLLGLAGVTTPVWVLLLVRPKPNAVQDESERQDE